MMKEDVYALCDGDLPDFVNEIEGLFSGLESLCKCSLTDVSLAQLRSYLKERPLQSVEERYLRPGGRHYSSRHLDFWKRNIEECPAKVVRLDACIRVINECKTMTSYKMAVNEVTRLVYGRDQAPFFRGKRYDPDRLEL
jgi:hypothetical protein